MTKLGSLNVIVRNATVRTNGPNGRVKVLTEVIVRMGGEPIADRKIPGKWTTGEALGEFRKQPHLFTPRGGPWTKETLKAIAA